MRCVAVCCRVLRCVAVCCRVLRCGVVLYRRQLEAVSANRHSPHCNIDHVGKALQHTATHCNTLQHNATHCNTPQIDIHLIVTSIT